MMSLTEYGILKTLVILVAVGGCLYALEVNKMKDENTLWASRVAIVCVGAFCFWSMVLGGTDEDPSTVFGFKNTDAPVTPTMSETGGDVDDNPDTDDKEEYEKASEGEKAAKRVKEQPMAYDTADNTYAMSLDDDGDGKSVPTYGSAPPAEEKGQYGVDAADVDVNPFDGHSELADHSTNDDTVEDGTPKPFADLDDYSLFSPYESTELLENEPFSTVAPRPTPTLQEIRPAGQKGNNDPALSALGAAQNTERTLGVSM